MEVETFHYFAYGSNMLTQRLKARCPSAVVTGRASASRWVIEFSKRGKDGSGKATLSEKAGCRTPGILFRIPIKERGALDRAEGVCDGGYRRCNAFPVRRVDSDETIIASTYLATQPESRLRPYDWYLALVIAGALQHEFDDDYVDSLRRETFKPDTEDRRKTRDQALCALRKAGYPDYRQLLPQR